MYNTGYDVLNYYTSYLVLCQYVINGVDVYKRQPKPAATPVVRPTVEPEESGAAGEEADRQSAA